MRRQLLLLLVALVIAAAPLSATAKGVHAQQPPSHVCWTSDADGVVYPDWHGSLYNTVWDSYGGGQWRTVWVDLQGWRYTGYDNECYRSYRASIWLPAGNGGAQMEADMRVWVCGNQVAYDRSSFNWGTWADITPGATEGDITVSTQMPDGSYRNLGYWRYSGSGANPYFCNPQSDNYYTTADSPTWQFAPTAIPAHNELYLYMDNGVQHN